MLALGFGFEVAGLEACARVGSLSIDICGLGWGPLLLLEIGIMSLEGPPVGWSLPVDAYGLWQGPSITMLLLLGLLRDILN